MKLLVLTAVLLGGCACATRPATDINPLDVPCGIVSISDPIGAAALGVCGAAILVDATRMVRSCSE